MSRKKKSGNEVASAAALLGAAGGSAGKGESKRRGDPEFYRKLVAKRKDRRRLGPVEK